MLDFTSSLYLGLHHPSRSLAPWGRLTTGVPAAMGEPPEAHQVARGRRATTAAAAGDAALHRAVPALRKELNGLVGAWFHRTGVPHGAVHTELRQACGGPPAAQASAEQLQARIDLIRSWALRRR